MPKIKKQKEQMIEERKCQKFWNRLLGCPFKIDRIYRI